VSANPPEHLPLFRGPRPLKRWVYVGAYGPDVMLCAAQGRIGVIPFAWWAVWDRARLTEGRRGVRVSPQRVVVDGVLELELSGGAAVDAISPHDGRPIFTRKRVVTARGVCQGRRIDLRAIVDESAGYHARHTAWRWSAGVGTAVGGEEVAWNLVDGIHDAPAGSERAVWVDGVPHEVPPVTFARDLSAVGGLRFTAEATRSRRENFVVVRSDYEQPFGTFAGELPGGGPELREGWGVMERHDVTW
jgi:hypothetical protein